MCSTSALDKINPRDRNLKLAKINYPLLIVFVCDLYNYRSVPSIAKIVKDKSFKSNASWQHDTVRI